MDRRQVLILTTLSFVASQVGAAPILTNFRFGILRQLGEESFEFVSQTQLIPRKTKQTGFRFGIGFDNPKCEYIEWFEVIRLPKDLKAVSGNFQRTSARNLRTTTFRSNKASIIDDFWFDEGDPLGKHTIELHVNKSLRYTIDFEVVQEN